jgi:hypothetical protein
MHSGRERYHTRAAVPKAFGRSAAARSNDRASGAGRPPHNPDRRVFLPRTKTTKPARVHGRNARTLMRVDRRILDIERHFREVRSRLDASLSVRDRYARHARQRGGAVNDLLVGVLVHHRETMF